MRRWRQLALATSLLGVSHAAWPAPLELDGVRFAAEATAPSGTLPLRGAGTLRVGVVFKVYTAALYAPPGVAPVDAQTPRRLEIHYFVDLAADEIAAYAEDHLRSRLTVEDWRRLAPRVRAWHRAMRDVRDGDRYAMQYAGGRLSLELNGERLVEVADPELAAAYFGIWLGERPLDAGLRRALLGERSG